MLTEKEFHKIFKSILGGMLKLISHKNFALKIYPFSNVKFILILSQIFARACEYVSPQKKIRARIKNILLNEKVLTLENDH